ncbi:MAG: hypothetical protein ACE5D7_02120 [Fidelibacterota bacterium]
MSYCIRNIIIFSSIILLTGCIQKVEEPRNTYFSDTIVVWDNSHDVYHKLLFHTVYLENSTISGFSLNTLQTETFHISEDNLEQFNMMREKNGVNTSEIKCTKCHPSVARP